MANQTNTKSELGKFIAVIGTVLGVAAGSIFFLNQFVFSSKHAAAVKTTAPSEAGKNLGVSEVPLINEEPPAKNSAAQQPPAAAKATPPSVAAAEPFYASLQMGEYAAVLNQDGTEKVIPFDMTKEEVKTLLGKPKSESYVDGETRSLCYSYGAFSIFFDDQDQRISYMTYAGSKELLNKQWLASLSKTLDSGNVDFYESPTGYTMVKVDDYPDSKEVVVYLLKNYPEENNQRAAAPSTGQSQAGQTSEPVSKPATKPAAKPANPPSKERMNANGEQVLSPGEEIVIDNVQVTNDSRVHTAAYTIDVNYSFAFNSPNMVKVTTDPEKKLELMPGESATVQIKVKASKSAPKGSYRFIVSLKQGWSSRPLKDFTVDVK
ncbi:hypothetical protein [Brevibacillus brevis]|uniref:DUF4352 domain-containing protein n=1 Tax=Brevibacillus brevis TaxID=1393 RepID=A0ABY9T9L1_BREBE|nr:hypothetical protein [Brevibacillus brevis]WNC16786.1 hypothetical protein RGB73_10840 [Brevibacillus brevis]